MEVGRTEWSLMQQCIRKRVASTCSKAVVVQTRYDVAKTKRIMDRYVAITIFLMVVRTESAPSPLRLTIDCGSDEMASSFQGSKKSKSTQNNEISRFDVDSFCKLIHNAIPKAVKDGKFILIESDMDQIGFGDTQVPVSLAPPGGFIPNIGVPRWKVPKLKIPKINVPKLRPHAENTFKAPRIGSPMSLSVVRSSDVEDESSAEKMEKFKKGVQKMLHVVKVLGQIDRYLSERTRIIIDKLSKTLAE